MIQVAQRLQPLGNDVAAGDSGQGRDKGDATRIMFERRIVEALSPADPRKGMSSCHKQTPVVEASGRVGGLRHGLRLSGTASGRTCALQSLQDNIGPKLMQRVTHAALIVERETACERRLAPADDLDKRARA